MDRETGQELVKYRGQQEEMDLATAYALAKTNPSSRTVEKAAQTRRVQVRKFLEWVGKDVEDVTREDIEGYRAEMEAAGYAKATQYQRISLLSQFFEYAISQGIITHNPVRAISRNGFRPRPYSSEQTRGLAPEEVRAFFGAIDRETVTGARLFAMCRLMLECGLRAAEVCDISWRNTRLSEDEPTVRTKVKGGDWSTFPLSDQAVLDIRHYLTLAGRKPKAKDSLFTSTGRKRRGKKNRGLTPNLLWYQFKGVAEKAGVEMSPHTLRHTHAQQAEVAGIPVREIQASLGHRSVETTLTYLDKLAPRSRRVGKAVQRAIWGEDEEADEGGDDPSPSPPAEGS